MTTEELQERQKKEFDEYIAASNEAFNQMQAKHDELFDVCFDEGIDVPGRLRERMRLESEAYKKEWLDPGEKWQALKEKHSKENEDFHKVEKFKDYLENLTQKEDFYKQTGREL